MTEPVDNSHGHNIEDRSKRFRVGHYLTPHSDIVALMVMEHQTLVHNRLTKASYETRKALHYEQTMNEALGNEPGQRQNRTKSSRTSLHPIVPRSSKSSVTRNRTCPTTGQAPQLTDRNDSMLVPGMNTMSAISSFSPTPSTPVRLRPRGHGAYAILGMPLLTALLIGGPSSVGLLTTVAAIAGFLANEPLLIVCGRRGQRTRSAVPVARRTLVTLLSIATVSGSLALWQGTTGVRVALVASGLAMELPMWRTISLLLLAAGVLRVWPPEVLNLGQLGWRLLAVNVLSCLWMVAWYASPVTTVSV